MVQLQNEEAICIACGDELVQDEMNIVEVYNPDPEAVESIEVHDKCAERAQMEVV